jgi:hypothetical protein
MPGMYGSDHEPISVTLSPTQVDEILRAASQSRAPSVAGLIADALSTSALSSAAARDENPGSNGLTPPPAGYLSGDTSDRRLSRSLLRGLSILTCFGASGEERGIVELSRDLGMSASTAHRYALTLVELGLLERCPRSRKYRLPHALTA